MLGCLFESKQGRRAILAKVTIDATGDGDLYAAAGAAHDATVDPQDIHACTNTAWLFGGVDMAAFLKFRAEEPDQYAALLALGRERLRYFEKPAVAWRDDIALFLGPRLSGYSALDVEPIALIETETGDWIIRYFDLDLGILKRKTLTLARPKKQRRSPARRRRLHHRAVDLMDNAVALPTTPQPQQQPEP